MPEFNLVTVITSTAQTVTAIVMAVLLLGFLRQYKKDYLRHWTLSWTALAAYYVTTSIGIALGVGYTMFSAALLLYALQQAYQVGVSVGWRFFAQSAGTIYLGYIAFLLQAVTGMSMIACLLEDEREASELATVEMEHLAYHDALTGLPNRPLFMDRLIMSLAQAGRVNQKVAVFFLDLDRFKDINDSLGHSTGH